MEVPDLSYEELRRKRVEENKRRMEALNLPALSQALHKSSPKKQPKPRIIEKQLVEVRRSSRIAKNSTPGPVYAETPKARDFHALDEARRDAFERAEQIKSELEPNYPGFIMSVLRSHVCGGSKLGLPAHFCTMHLSNRDGRITLIDEGGHEYQTVYLVRKVGSTRKSELSGGWRGFSVAHKLVYGDALIFQLIEPSKCKLDGNSHVIYVEEAARTRLLIDERTCLLQNHDPSKLVVETLCKLLRFLVSDGSHIDVDTQYRS